jgi:hypothetical protein
MMGAPEAQMSAERFPHLSAHDSAVARKVAPAGRREPAASAHPLLGLQRAVGNAAVMRMIQAQHDASLQREEEAESEDEEMQAVHDASLQRQGPEEEEPLQGKHDDSLQRQGPEEEEPLQGKHDHSLQRQGPEEEEPLQGKHDHSLQRQGPEEEEPLQGKHDLATPHVGLEGGAVGGDISGAIDRKRGAGASLDGGVRSRMEGAFDTSFGNVRVHHDNESDALTRQVTSKAFTTGSDVFLRADQNPSDGNLLAHELTHVVQQRSMSGSGPMSVRPAGDQYEQEADRVADSVMNAPQRQVEIEV